jgi:hypothetical protein
VVVVLGGVCVLLGHVVISQSAKGC